MIIDGEEVELVSAHGGHSGQFCSHADGALEDIVLAYIEKGFSWIGITEHIPPAEDRFLFPFDQRAGCTAESFQAKFYEYINVCRELQAKYRTHIKILIGFETDLWSGYQEHIRKLINQHQPDYFVGSVHAVDDVFFETSREVYWSLVEQLGGIEQLYLRYFDCQFEMIASLKPSVIGHFDVIRGKDPHFAVTMKRPAIVERIKRNLTLIKDLDLALDFNVSQYRKGASEPCPGCQVLSEAIKMGIRLLPGDDAHCVADVGSGMKEGLQLLKRMGGCLRWQVPNLVAPAELGARATA